MFSILVLLSLIAYICVAFNILPTTVEHTCFRFVFFLGNSPQVVTWCQAYNNTQRLMKTIVDLSFDPSTAYHNYKIEVSPQRDDEVNVCFKFGFSLPR